MSMSSPKVRLRCEAINRGMLDLHQMMVALEILFICSWAGIIHYCFCKSHQPYNPDRGNKPLQNFFLSLSILFINHEIILWVIIHLCCFQDFMDFLFSVLVRVVMLRRLSTRELKLAGTHPCTGQHKLLLLWELWFFQLSLKYASFLYWYCCLPAFFHFAWTGGWNDLMLVTGRVA